MPPRGSPERSAARTTLLHIVQATVKQGREALDQLRQWLYADPTSTQESALSGDRWSDQGPALEIAMEGSTRRSRRFEPDEVVLFGREPSADVYCQGADVEPKHALAFCQAGQWTMLDLHSLAGIRIGGHETPRHVIKNGDRLEVGGVSLQLTLIPPAKGTRGSRGSSPEKREAPMDLVAPRRVGRFELTQLVHEGSSGRIYRARWLSKGGRDVAVKIFSKDMTRDEEAMYRFCRGATTAAALRHPHLLRLYRGGKSDGSWYLAMEWMANGSLRDVLKATPDHRVTPAFARRMGIDLCRALEVAENERVLHRMINPSSVLFNDQWSAKLGDFILARGIDLNRSQQLTGAGDILGETPYLSPEQATGKVALDHRADLYSLGATLYQALSGQPPFKAANALHLIRAICDEPAPSLLRLVPDLSRGLDKVILQALEKSPSRRFSSAAQMREALEQAIT